MKKQKICIVGDGLAGLTVALSLEARNMDIDLYYSKSPKDKKRDSRVTAISSSNFDFLREKIGISNKKLLKKDFEDLAYFNPFYVKDFMPHKKNS